MYGHYERAGNGGNSVGMVALHPWPRALPIHMPRLGHERTDPALTIVGEPTFLDASEIPKFRRALETSSISLSLGQPFPIQVICILIVHSNARSHSVVSERTADIVNQSTVNQSTMNVQRRNRASPTLCRVGNGGSFPTLRRLP